MLVKQIVYFLCLFIFFNSIIIWSYAKKNKNKRVCKYIMVLSIIHIIYLILDIGFLPLQLNLSIEFEILLYRGLLLITIILLIISIIISNKKIDKLDTMETSKKDKIILLLLIIGPVVIFSFSYFREMYYINNSELVLVCTFGENFSEEDTAYAINDNYCKEISIGTDFRGYEMEKHLPKEFNKLNYSWVTDSVEIADNKIVIYRNHEVIYEGKINSNISTYGLRKIFYK